MSLIFGAKIWTSTFNSSLWYSLFLNEIEIIDTAGTILQFVVVSFDKCWTPTTMLHTNGEWCMLFTDSAWKPSPSFSTDQWGAKDIERQRWDCCTWVNTLIWLKLAIMRLCKGTARSNMKRHLTCDVLVFICLQSCKAEHCWEGNLNCKLEKINGANHDRKCWLATASICTISRVRFIILREITTTKYKMFP